MKESPTGNSVYYWSLISKLEGQAYISGLSQTYWALWSSSLYVDWDNYRNSV